MLAFAYLPVLSAYKLKRFAMTMLSMETFTGNDFFHNSRPLNNVGGMSNSVNQGCFFSASDVAELLRRTGACWLHDVRHPIFSRICQPTRQTCTTLIGLLPGVLTGVE